jgi:hypothetical protein
MVQVSQTRIASAQQMTGMDDVSGEGEEEEGELNLESKKVCR